MINCPRCGGNIVKNYGELSCLQCGYSITDSQDTLMIGLLMQERNKKWQQSETNHGTENLNYGPRLPFSTNYGEGV